MDDIVREATNIAKLKLNDYSKSKAAFLLDTDKGSMILKKQNEPREKIELYYRTSEAMYDQGFSGCERYVTTNNKPYLTIRDNLYTITSYGGGDKCSFSETYNAIHTASALANLHNAGANVAIEGLKLSNTLLEGKYGTRMAEARHIKKWLDGQGSFTDTDVIFIKNYKEYIDKSEKAAVEIVKAIANSKPSLCIEEIKEDNVFITESGNVTFVNFENFTRSIPIIDLCKLIHRFIKRGGNSADVSLIIDTYRSQKPLSESDIQLIRVYLSFPHKFFLLANKYYNSRRVFDNSQTYARLKSAIAHQAKLYNVLENLSKYK